MRFPWAELHPTNLLQNLEELIVYESDNVEEEFDIEGLTICDGHVELLPKLKRLDLFQLPKLGHICDWGSSTTNEDNFPSSACIVIFPKLTRMSLGSLTALTTFFPGFRYLQRHDVDHADLDTPLFDERSVLLIQLPKYECGGRCHCHSVESLGSKVAAKSREDMEF